jgi:hypothetical protein
MESVPTELFLEGYPPGIRAKADELRAIFHRAVPDAIERVRLGWRAIGYDIPIGRRTRYFGFVWPETEHVHFGFEYGILMNDPDGLLRGAEIKLKKVRFVTFEPGDAVPEQSLIWLAREGVRVATMSKEERLAMELDRDA